MSPAELLEQLRQGVQTDSPEQTENIGADLAVALAGQAVICLEGPLGAGKTCFVRGLARGLGCETPVTSPTFNLFQIYNGPRRLLHVDAYRLSAPTQMDDLGLEDWMDAQTVLAIEWPENVRPWLPPKHYWLRLSAVSENRREIQLTAG